MKKVYLLGGKIDSGKNYVANEMTRILEGSGKSVLRMMFAQGVKDGCREDFSRLSEYLNSLAEELSLRGEKSIAGLLRIGYENWYEDKTPITRILLQTYGTDIFRNRVDEDWWVKKAAERINRATEDIIIITDFRFPNECDKLKELVGDGREVVSIKVEREAKTDELLASHSSENAFGGFEFDHEIKNDGKEDLVAVLRRILL